MRRPTISRAVSTRNHRKQPRRARFEFFIVVRRYPNLYIRTLIVRSLAENSGAKGWRVQIASGSLRPEGGPLSHIVSRSCTRFSTRVPLMQESNISLKAILRTGNTGYTCNHVEISTWISPRPAEGPSWSTSLPSVPPPSFTDLLGKARRTTVCGDLWLAGPSIHRCIDRARF